MLHNAGRRIGRDKARVLLLDVVSQVFQTCWSFLVCQLRMPVRLLQLLTLLGLDPRRVVLVCKSRHEKPSSIGRSRRKWMST